MVDKVVPIANDFDDPVADDELKAMLHQISHDEHIHLAEQFAMHPLDFNDTVQPSAYFQQVPVSGEPVNPRTPGMECMAFPHLHPTGKFGKHWPRMKSLGDVEFHKTRLLHSDRRFAQDQSYLFWLCQESQMKALSAGVHHYMTSVLANEHLNVGKFLAMAENNERQINNNVMNILASVQVRRSSGSVVDVRSSP